ncbi:MAG: NAD(P)H-hydrate dehydratase [Acutalibacteraceae bacterium]
MNEIFALFNKRDQNSNKGDFGRALLICGSYGMAGAAIIAADACIKSGIGICDIACQDTVYPIISSAVPEAVCTPLSKSFNTCDKNKLKASLKKASCVVIGCGMGNTEYTSKILQTVIEHCSVPLVIDADALNVLSADVDLLKCAKCKIIVTPHPGEMSRLIKKSIKEINENRIETAVEFSKKYSVVTLLKGHNTVISDTNGEYFINETGNAGMATGGSGDMLCGVIAAFLGEKLSPFDAARAGAYIHGLAGDLSAKKFSQRSTTPRTMISQLPEIFLEAEK